MALWEDFPRGFLLDIIAGLRYNLHSMEMVSLIFQ